MLTKRELAKLKEKVNYFPYVAYCYTYCVYVKPLFDPGLDWRFLPYHFSFFKLVWYKFPNLRYITPF